MKHSIRNTSENNTWRKAIGLSVCGVLSFCAGAVFADKIGDLRYARGMDQMHKAGLVKFYDPENNNCELNIEDACKVVKRTFNLEH